MIRLSKVKDNKITILIPVFEEPEIVAKFVDENKSILKRYPVFVLNKKGGAILKEYTSFYKKSSCPTIGWPLGSSRKFLIRRVQTEFSLNLDVDTILPPDFVNEALKKLNDPKVGAIALDYENPQGHLAFGPSLWRTKVLQKLYDYTFWKPKCECIYMWNKLHRANLKVETLNKKAKHLKLLGDSIRQNKAGFLDYLWNIFISIAAKFKKIVY